MRLDIPLDELDRIESSLPRLAPWMHPFQLGDGVYTGYFKHHQLDQTYCTRASEPAFVERMHAAFEEYMEARPFALLDELLQHVQDPASASALDIACATGRATFYLAQAGVGAVRGVEIRPEQIEQARLLRDADTLLSQAGVTLDHVSTSADDPDFLAGERYDLVLSLGLLYHLTNPIQHLINLRRLTKRFALVHTTAQTVGPQLWHWRTENPAWMTKAVGGFSLLPYVLDVPRLLREIGFDRVSFVFHPLVEPLQRRLVGALERRDASSGGTVARAAAWARYRVASRAIGHAIAREEGRLERAYLAPGQFAWLAEVRPESGSTLVP